MGSCSSSGKGGGGRYISSDKTLTRVEKPIEVERMLGGYVGGTVLSARTDGKGNLMLDYAGYDSIREQNKKRNTRNTASRME